MRGLDLSEYHHRYDRISKHFYYSFSKEISLPKSPKISDAEHQKEIDAYNNQPNVVGKRKAIDCFERILNDWYYDFDDLVFINHINQFTITNSYFKMKGDIKESDKNDTYRKLDSLFTKYLSLETKHGSPFFSHQLSRYIISNPVFDIRSRTRPIYKDDDAPKNWSIVNPNIKNGQVSFTVPQALCEENVGFEKPSYWRIGLVDGRTNDILCIPQVLDNNGIPLIKINELLHSEFMLKDSGGVFLTNIKFLRTAASFRDEKPYDSSNSYQIHFPSGSLFSETNIHEYNAKYSDLFTKLPYLLIWDYYGNLVFRKIAPVKYGVIKDIYKKYFEDKNEEKIKEHENDLYYLFMSELEEYLERNDFSDISEIEILDVIRQQVSHYSHIDPYEY